MKPPHPEEHESTAAEKKTRDLPNLSECHSCGFRIDTCAGKNNRIHPLYSEWRVVLLCNKCISQVESSILCSYCFKQACNSNSLPCSQCNRLVHKTCYSDRSTMPPWSYHSYSSSQPWVCVDCWVPKSIVVKRELRARRRKRKRHDNCFGDVTKDASSAVEKKVEEDAEARQLAVAKALVARRASKLVRGTLDFVTNAGGVESNDGDGNDFLLRLNRSMNGGSRIFKNFCPVNSSCLTYRRMRKFKGGCLANRDLCEKLEVCTDKLVSYPFVYTRMRHRLVCYPLVYTRMRRSAKRGDVDVRMEGEGSCSSKLINALGDYYNSTNSGQSCRGGDESTEAEDDVSNVNHNRYLIKYSRKKLNERSIPDNGSRILYTGLRHETQPSAAELLLSFSKESVTFSNSSLQSCTFSQQASASSSGLSRG